MSISIFCIMPFCNKLSTIWKQCKYRLYRSTNLHVRSIADVYSEKSEFHWLSNCSPSFIIDGDKVHVLNEPCEFYETLKINISQAKRRIAIASLYLGTGKLEEELVGAIRHSLLNSRNNGNDLKVSILLDHTRGSRGQEKNSRTMLLPLLMEFPKHVDIALFHTPALRGLLRWIIPEKYNETIGVSHLKVYLTDDTFILTGANLSNDYFTNRQDRYILIEKSPHIADYFENLVTMVSGFSLQLHPDNVTSMSNVKFPAHPYKDWDRGRKFCGIANGTVNKFIKKWTKESEKVSKYSKGDTVIYPLLQMGLFGITQDENVTLKLLLDMPEASTTHLATGYFNLTPHYSNCILNSKGNYEILCAHPLANGFYKAGGIIGGIPDAFTNFAKEFFNHVQHFKHFEWIKVNEYIRSYWTFHAKGLWYTPQDDHYPNMSMIGSSNFGHRSVKRDLENQTILLTSNEKLRYMLGKERDHVFKYIVKVTNETFEAIERRVPIWVKIISYFTRSFF
ncbi:CDP-diacylglycerol--glycerol-3-phosphate 3-phosphatidyltransferase, mitochondrial-like [Xenia sp. Carnegie-2017]|uniref:CDP-diacylglycerol--glycerol-3-phosphate 3-phosphatidyltransferase, mitochondrial-like n=1 Tax=Xenia sp. Carnegie-2017 TaxID=2897299 RepID=UPI001F04E758|nr:CDP-diacylglycerol--glycerol-3-phosphate 3-phosphatidyltransferase, mitochondrial-like [Xenia sp. Carnegie-2017]